MTTLHSPRGRWAQTKRPGGWYAAGSQFLPSCDPGSLRPSLPDLQIEESFSWSRRRC